MTVIRKTIITAVSRKRMYINGSTIWRLCWKKNREPQRFMTSYMAKKSFLTSVF